MANYTDDLALIVRYDGTVDAFDAVKSSFLGKVVFITGSSATNASNDEKKQAVWVSNGVGGKYLNMSDINTIKNELEHITKVYVGTQAYSGVGGVAYQFVGADGVGITLSQNDGKAVITFSGKELQNAIIGTANDTEATPTIQGAKKYAQNQAIAEGSRAVANANIYTDSAISQAKIDITGVEGKDTASSDTIWGAKKYAESKANSAKNTAIDTANEAIEDAKIDLIGNENDDPTADPTIKGVFNYAKQGVDASKVTIVTSTGTGDVATQYDIKQGNAIVGTIKIAKAMVIESGSIVDGYWVNGSFTEDVNGPDKAIKLVLQGQASALYINVADLIDAYTAEQNASQVQLSIAADNTISAILVDGGVSTNKIANNAVTKAKLDSMVQASLVKADNAYQKPSTGIPLGDLNASVQASLDNADTAVQSVTASTTDTDYLGVTNGSSNTIRTIGINVKVAEISSETAITKGLATVEDIRAYLKARLSVKVVS